jgi:hypothetical protein
MGVAMAGQAAPHAHQHLPGNLLHTLNLSMAALTSDARADMRPVIEKHVVRQGIDPLPFQHLVALEYGREALDLGLVGPSDRVAIHAGLGSRYPGVARTLCAGVAVQAGNVVVTRVQPM